MTPHAFLPEPEELMSMQNQAGMKNTLSTSGLLHAISAIDDTSRPSAPRRSTEPNMPSSPPQSCKPLPLRARNRSPYTTQSRVVAITSSPPMVRAHSSPIVDAFGHFHVAPYARPSSPLFASSRRQSPRRWPLDEAYLITTTSGHTSLDVGQTISENSELDLSPRPPLSDTEVFPTSPITIHHTFPRSRRRPVSPLQNIIQPPSYSAHSQLHTSFSSPALTAKFNESYPSSISSVPSTPTSLRSRSPSISSLETIEDSPDAEEAAQEADSIAELRAAAEGEERERRRRGSMEVATRPSGGVLMGGRDKRKRWSVCGAERRGDLDLETIWED
ncbi:hypothetical protein MMC13_001194 [Lambiella insularis]|nr:hypothetical protein [Lambiella insularis]